MDKKKLLSVLVIAGIILSIGIISAFLLLDGKDEATQPVGENEGVVVDIDKKDRNEDEIKDDFEETVEKEREKRPVGMVDLPENINKDGEGEEIKATDIIEETIGDKKITKGNTVNGNTVTIVTPNNENNKNVKVVDGVTNDFSNVGKLPKVETENSDYYLDERGIRIIKPNINELAEKVEDVYKNTGFTFYSVEGRNSFNLDNKIESHSYIEDNNYKMYQASLHNGKTYWIGYT